MKTLYISDLDGTLLTKDMTTTEFTNMTINELTEKGMLFSYATARSFHTSRKVTSGIQAEIPVIVYNGVMVLDSVTKEVLVAHYFDLKIQYVLDDLLAHGIYPITYARIHGEEKMSFVKEKNTLGMDDYIASRKGDERLRPIVDVRCLYEGDLFYITCIDEPQKLLPFYEKYKEQYHCVYYQDIYSGEYWFEIMPKEASKANAALELKQLYHCDRLVVFGDGLNDYDMFEVADECYATSEAEEKLKAIATGVIGSHNDDAVAQWILKDFTSQQEG